MVKRKPKSTTSFRSVNWLLCSICYCLFVSLVKGAHKTKFTKTGQRHAPKFVTFLYLSLLYAECNDNCKRQSIVCNRFSCEGVHNSEDEQISTTET